MAIRAGSLTSVTLPDQTQWLINFSSLDTAAWSYSSATCNSLPTATLNASFSSGAVSGTIQAPTGAKGTFSFNVVRRGRNGPPSTCLTNSANVQFARLQPAVFDQLALVTKTITGPNISTLKWTIAYAGCTTTSCNASITTKVTDPNDYYDTKYTFGAAFNTNPDLDTEGQLQTVQGGGVSDANYLRTDTYAYFSSTGQAYPSVSGTPAQVRGDLTPISSLLPMSKRTISVNSATYTLTLSSPDSFGYATSAVRAGSATKTDTLAYDHNTTKWILGTLKTKSSAGATEYSAVLDTYEQPTSISKFGRQIESFTYATNGQIATYSDGNGNATTYSQYKRGIPQSIVYANTDAETVTVNDIGQITQWNSAAGFITTYGYDTGGRLNNITPPGYSATTITWTTGTTGWTRTQTRGAYSKVDVYDAFLRSTKTTEPGSRIVTRTYDGNGNTTFVSYPNSTDGVTSAYDSLNRLHSTQDTLGYTTLYTPGANSLQVTDRDNNVTKYSYMEYDEPSAAWPTSIAIPAITNYTTTVARDTWGKPKTISRGSISRTYTYYANQLLENLASSETGTSTFTYDGNGNVQTLKRPDGAVTTNYYDTRNRLYSITYSTNDPSVSYTWNPDNLPAAESRGNVSRSFAYNAGRLLQNEVVTVNGTSYQLSYGYNSDGQVNAFTYPDNTVVSLFPDAYGRPTTLGSGIASGITYYENGAIHFFNYGNGISHTLTLDARQLPKEVAEPGVDDITYAYDGMGFPKTISNTVGGTDTKTLGYDAANRLTSAVGTEWGSTTYSYDVYDNETQERTGSDTYPFTNDPTTNRLTASPGTTITYDARGNISDSQNMIRPFPMMPQMN